MFSGNVMNGPIGKQMVDTLVESSSNVEVLFNSYKICLIFSWCQKFAVLDAFFEIFISFENPVMLTSVYISTV